LKQFNQQKPQYAGLRYHQREIQLRRQDREVPRLHRPRKKTISDDGFESFPEYHRDDKIQDHEDSYERFLACVEEIQTYEDAQSHHDVPQIPESQPLIETTNPTTPTPSKKKRRKPILPKNKRNNRKSKGKGREADPATSESESYKSAQVGADDEDHEGGAEEGEGENWSDYLDGKPHPRVLAKVADDEEFAFRPQEIEFLWAFKNMTREQQKREMERLLGSLMGGE
jgi:hypothetical protein